MDSNTLGVRDDRPGRLSHMRPSRGAAQLLYNDGAAAGECWPVASRKAAGARPWHARIRDGVDEVRVHGILAGLALTAALLIAPRVMAVIVVMGAGA